MTTPGALPTFWEVAVPPAWRSIDFISDLHLGQSTTATFDGFASHLLGTDADAVFILGDLFEVWVGDDSRHEGFEARVFDVLAEAAAVRTVGFMAGNRDFLVGGEMLKACGAMALADPTVLIAFDERLLVTHGDMLCMGDTDYQRFREQVRQPAWQQAFLARPLHERRRIGREARHESECRRTGAGYLAHDADSATAVRWMHEAGTPTLVHGHTHRPGSEPLAPGFMRHVLSDWDLDDPVAPRAEVLRWTRGGLARIAPVLPPR